MDVPASVNPGSRLMRPPQTSTWSPSVTSTLPWRSSSDRPKSSSSVAMRSRASLCHSSSTPERSSKGIQLSFPQASRRLPGPGPAATSRWSRAAATAKSCPAPLVKTPRMSCADGWPVPPEMRE